MFHHEKPTTRLVVLEMPHRHVDLALACRALANPKRIALLRFLATPRSIGEVRLPAGAQDGWGRGSRALTRQAVRRHLTALVRAGLVNRTSSGGRLCYVTEASRLAWAGERLLEISRELCREK